MSQWCHPANSSSIIPLSSCPQSFPASGSFQMSQLFASGIQGTGVSVSTSVLPMNTQDWFKMDWLNILAVQETLKSLLQHHCSKASIIWHLAFFIVQISHPYTLLQSPTAVILDLKKNKVCHCFPIYLPWSDGTRFHNLSFLNVELQENFSLSSCTFIKSLFSSSLSAIRVMSSAYLRLLIFLPAVLIPAWASSSLAFWVMHSA